MEFKRQKSAEKTCDVISKDANGVPQYKTNFSAWKNMKNQSAREIVLFNQFQNKESSCQSLPKRLLVIERVRTFECAISACGILPGVYRGFAAEPSLIRSLAMMN